MGGTVGGLVAITWNPGLSRYLLPATMIGKINQLYKCVSVCVKEEKERDIPACLKGFLLITSDIIGLEIWTPDNASNSFTLSHTAFLLHPSFLVTTTTAKAAAAIGTGIAVDKWEYEWTTSWVNIHVKGLSETFIKKSKRL